MKDKIKGFLRRSLAVDEPVADHEDCEANHESRPTRSDLVSREINRECAHCRSKDEFKELYHTNHLP